MLGSYGNDSGRPNFGGRERTALLSFLQKENPASPHAKSKKHYKEKDEKFPTRVPIGRQKEKEGK
jgi:hypothetical protein